jgi:DNA-binding response OmpR family regulator
VSAPLAARRILVVDDEEDASVALAEILAQKGHTIRVVPDGAGALAVAPTFDPELVLLDLGLPGMDGYEVARRLRTLLGWQVKIVALTGYRDDQVRLVEAGFDGHLLKPTSPAKLFALVAALDRPGVAALAQPARQPRPPRAGPRP